MGSIVSRPKVPTVTTPQVVYVPAPVTETPTVKTPEPTTPADDTPPSGDGGATETPADTQTPEEAQSQARESGLLNRTRGRLSTIVTGYRGILSNGPAVSSRKTLLGE